MIKTAVSGSTGRMGRMLVEAVLDAPDLELAAALVAPGETAEGSDAAAFLGRTSGVTMASSVQALSAARVLIDFTRPAGTLGYLAWCRENGVAMVIGTTGFDAEGRRLIAEAARDIPIVFSPNMDVGVNVVFRLLEDAGRMLADYDCEIVEMHHRHKVDAPSGTALEMGRAVARGRGTDFDSAAVLSREGHTGERRPGAIGFAALRGGDVVGDHTVIFAGPGERIEISHKSGSRAGYAAGALAAARFAAARENGLYTMADVLGLH